jgi:hypothetical protein
MFDILGRLQGGVTAATGFGESVLADSDTASVGGV